MVYCDKSNSMDVFNSVHNRSKYLKKVLKMKKDVFLHGNNQIMIVPLKPIIITKSLIMNKIMRLFFMNLKSPRTYFKLSAAFVFLMSSMISTVSLFGQAPDAVLKAKTNVNCFGGNDGTIEVQVLTGDPVFRFSIYGGSPYQYSPKFINLYAGNYTVTVTDTNGLTDTVQVIVDEPISALVVSTPSSLLRNVDCKGNNTAFVEAAVSGGTSPYSYSWNSIPSQTTAKATNLYAGSYIVTVTDANNCVGTKSITLTEPTALTLSGSVTNVACKGNSTGSVILTAGGGTSPYTYKNGTGSYQASATFSTLAAGSYTFTVLDANGCTQTVTSTVTEPSVLNLSASVTNPVCIQDKTGIVTLSVTGGTSTYSYRIDSTVNSITKSFVATSTYNSLYEGKYSAEVKDTNGCLDTVQIIIKHFDAVKPVPVPRKILTVYLGALGSVNVSANMADSISSDNCGIASLSISKTTFNCSNIGYNTVQFKIVDVNSNIDSINFIVNVKDTTRPKINTRDFTIYLDASGLANLSIDSIDLGSTDVCGSVTRRQHCNLFC